MSNGWIRNVADRLAETLAQCHALQTWQGADWTPVQLLERIHHHALPPPASGDEHTLAELQGYRPFILLYTEQGGGLTLQRDATGPACGGTAEGHLVVQLEQDVPVADAADAAKAERDFERVVGLMMSTGVVAQPGLLELAADPQWLPVTQLVFRGIVRVDPEDVQQIGDAQRAFVDVMWRIG